MSDQTTDEQARRPTSRDAKSTQAMLDSVIAGARAQWEAEWRAAQFAEDRIVSATPHHTGRLIAVTLKGRIFEQVSDPNQMNTPRSGGTIWREVPGPNLKG